MCLAAPIARFAYAPTERRNAIFYFPHKAYSYGIKEQTTARFSLRVSLPKKNNAVALIRARCEQNGACGMPWLQLILTVGFVLGCRRRRRLALVLYEILWSDGCMSTSIIFRLMPHRVKVVSTTARLERALLARLKQENYFVSTLDTNMHCHQNRHR